MPSAADRSPAPIPLTSRERTVHPGSVLNADYLSPLGLSQNKLARAMGVPPRRINEIVHGNRAVTADTALRLARCLGTTATYWMDLQARYDLAVTRAGAGDRIAKEVRPLTRHA